MPKKRLPRRTKNAGGDSPAASEEKVKLAEPVGPISALKPIKRLVRQVINDPNIGYQFLAVLLTLTADDFKMDRRIDTMTSSLDTLRNITNVVTNTMQSLKSAAEAPRQIRRLVKPDGG